MNISSLKKRAVTVAVGAALAGLAGSALAVPGVLFDADGTLGGGAVGVTQFQWTQMTYMIRNGITNSTTTTNVVAGTPNADTGNNGGGSTDTQGRVVGQGQMNGGYLNSNGQQINSASFGNFTYVFSIPVDTLKTVPGTGVNTAGTTLDFNPATGVGADPFGVNNYFKLYYNPTGPNAAAGTDFGASENNASMPAGSILILSGKLSIDSANVKQNSNPVGDVYVPIGTAGTTSQAGSPILTVRVGGGSSINLNVEVCSAAEVLNPLALACFGQPVSTVNTDFFKSSISDMNLEITGNPDATFGGGVQDPFGTGANVPAMIDNLTPKFGNSTADDPDTAGIQTVWLNNFTCDGGIGGKCDMIYQGQLGKSDVNASFAPEPMSLALLGIGLAGLGFNLRRKNGRFA